MSSSSGPASAVWARPAPCASKASTTSPSSSEPTPSAGCGATTPIPVQPATCRHPVLLVVGDQPRLGPPLLAPAGDPGLPPEAAGREGLLDLVRTGVEVASCRFDEATGGWKVMDTSGTAYDADVVISAVGGSPTRWSRRSRAPSRSRARLPLRRVAPRRRPHRQAGRGRRHGSQRDPVRAGDRRRGRLDDGLPALRAVRRAQARPGVPALPPPRVRPLPEAPRGGAPLDVLAHRAAQQRPCRRLAYLQAVAGHHAGRVEAAAAPPGAGRRAATPAAARLRRSGANGSSSPTTGTPPWPATTSTW